MVEVVALGLPKTRARRSLKGTTDATSIDQSRAEVVRKGVEHKPYAEREVKLMLIEPRGVPNTGDQGGSRTALSDVWV
jgi:hypothetical protein